tara:strand:+ start:116 stop:1132 length:1017 start_codon:yes stop_codon:yes gene_type:complete
MKGYFSKLRIFHQNYHMVRSKSENIITVDQPMVLISQAPRSGGTLLKRLFDNHNECHVYPVEFAMGINKDVDYSWPDNLLSMKKKEWLENLIQPHHWRWLKEDFQYWINDEERHPLIFLPLLCDKIFKESVSNIDIKNERQIFDSFMTSFFNSWIDYQNLYSHIDKKSIIAFAPKMINKKGNIKKFLNVYPDGKLISIVRNPVSWYASSQKRWPKVYSDLESSLNNVWIDSVRNAIQLKKVFPENIIIVSFESLISKSNHVMQLLCDLIKIKFSKDMMVPTFNGRPIISNSSFKRVKGIDLEVLNRFSENITDEKVSLINKITDNTYNSAKELFLLNE